MCLLYRPQQIHTHSSESEGIPSTAMREISLLKDIDHESIVALYDVVIADSNLYLVFEYLNMDLKKLLEKGKALFTPMLVKVYAPTVVCLFRWPFH